MIKFAMVFASSASITGGSMLANRVPYIILILVVVFIVWRLLYRRRR
jgi:hypothetical protein